MNKQTSRLLEQHFDTAFDTPDGIKKLRELSSNHFHAGQARKVYRRHQREPHRLTQCQNVEGLKF